jgi:hypothetical protein
MFPPAMEWQARQLPSLRLNASFLPCSTGVMAFLSAATALLTDTMARLPSNAATAVAVEIILAAFRMISSSIKYGDVLEIKAPTYTFIVKYGYLVTWCIYHCFL